MSESTIPNDADARQLLRDCAAAQWRGPTGFDAATLDGSLSTLVKRGDRREIYRVDSPHGAVYVKHRTSRFWQALVDRWRGSASQREFEHAVEAQRRGVLTVRALAYAADPRSGEQLLVTAALDGAVPLDAFIERHATTLAAGSPRRRALVDALAQLCAAAHEAGLEHDDLHAGNILVVWPEGEPHPRLHLIDLDKARFRKQLNWRAARRNLAMLFCALHQVANDRDLARFWRKYLERRPLFCLKAPIGFHWRPVRQCVAVSSPAPADEPPVAPKHRARLQTEPDRTIHRTQATEIQRLGMKRVQRVLRERDRRAVRNNRQFTMLHAAGGVALGLAQDAGARLDAWLSSVSELIATPGAVALKLSFGSVVMKTRLAGDAAEVIVLKRFRAKNWLKRLLAPWRPSRARINWIRGHALLARGIPVAQPRFAIEPWPAAWWGESYLATEWIPGARNLHLYLWELAKLPNADCRDALRSAAESLGALLGKLHFYGVAHRDLKGGNLTVAERDGAIHWYLLDLDGVRIKGPLSMSERAANLARLAVSAEMHSIISHADRWRFLRAYVRAAGQRDDLRALWRAIAAECRRHIHRLESRGSVVA